jgi:hypothetical protein
MIFATTRERFDYHGQGFIHTNGDVSIQQGKQQFQDICITISKKILHIMKIKYLDNLIIQHSTWPKRLYSYNIYMILHVSS